MRGLLLCLLVGHLAPALAFAPRCSAVASAHVRQGAATRPTGAAALRSRASSRQRRSATMELAVRSLAGREAYESALAPVTPSPDGPEQYTVVKYYASWCRACKALGPKVEKIARNYPSVRFYELEFEANKEFCKELGIKVLPWIEIFKNGRDNKLDSFSCGPAKAAQIAEKLRDYMDGVPPKAAVGAAGEAVAEAGEAGEAASS